MSPLAVDPDQIGRFVQTMFRHADEGTFASLRSFTHNAGDPPVEVRGVEINGEGLGPLIQIAIGAANRAARHHSPTVFAPPVATFTNRNKAREADLANGVALSVEIDAAATEGLALLRELLGPPSVVVASGGEWTDPATGEVQPKLHAHWRLSEPTRTTEEHGRLKRGRRAASALVGGDATNVPAVHPIRWPGSVHRKGEPKLANIVEINEDAEIDLGDALDRLEGAAAARGIFAEGTANGGGGGCEQSETAALIAEIMSGKAYVAPLTALSARYAGGGMTRPKIVDTLQGLMLAVPAEIRDGGQPGRWRSRFDGIPRMAASAIAKFGPKAEPETADGPSLAHGKRAAEELLREHARRAADDIARDQETVRGAEDQPWPEPLAPEAYHGIVGDIVRLIEPETEADPAALLFQLLAAIGNVLGNSAYARVEGDKHPPRLFVIQVGRTSKGRKGTSWGRVKALLSTVAEDWTRTRIASGLSSGEGVIYEIRDPVFNRKKDKKTGAVVEETVDLGVEDKRLLLFEGEIAKALRAMERQGNTLSAVLRDAWDHGDLRTLIKNDANRATGAHISLIGHVTDDELRRYLDRTEMANGLANRLIFVCGQRSKLLSRGGGGIDWSDVERRLLAILRRSPTGEIGRTDAAWRIWDGIYPELSADRPGMLGAILGRAEAQVLRLSLIYALLNGSAFIDAPHMLAALACWEYAEASARFIFGDALGDPVADEILRALRDHPEGMTRNELMNHFGRHQSSEQIGRALSVLARGNFVTSTTEKTAGRPADRWSATR